jgi:hypothetical protein
MLKRLIAKGNIHGSDHYRALVTDTIPGDIPIIVSNDGFYKNMKAAAEHGPHQAELINYILNSKRRYTIPYRFNIMRSSGVSRRLSLLHPSAQLGVVEMYRDFGHLICHYCRKSIASIRSPQKVASLFFVRGRSSNKNKLKGSSIDTVDIETTVSNPASYFAYKGEDRAYKFFQSTDYMRLEKRYAVMHFADIAKCFGSIYTHTLFWAVNDIRTAKENVSAATFSNAFDRLMQSMNYNETNGICVGPEVSRVFAEIILSEVDRRVVERLAERGLNYRSHYEFRRYVDDYFVFSIDGKVAERALNAIRLSLAEFNLHLNEEKTVQIGRPFITRKSRLVSEANSSLEAFFSKFIDIDYDASGAFWYPKPVRRSAALLRYLLDSIKSSCFDQQAGYNETSNYIIGALSSRISTLIADYEKGIELEAVRKEDYISAIVLLLEAIYFFYNVHPSVPSSLRVAQSAVIASHFFDREFPDRSAYLAEQVVRWTYQFIKGLGGGDTHRDADCIPLEALNILLVLGEIGRSEALAREVVKEFCGDVSVLRYFEIVSFLFCVRDDPLHSALRDALFQRARTILLDDTDTSVNAHAAHLALDLLACPFVPEIERANLFNELRLAANLAAVSIPDALTAVGSFQDSPWFVNWKEIDLLRMIQKKELSAVY